MVKSISGDLRTHLDGTVATLATIWRITRRDGTEFFFTDHDKDILFEGDTYVSAVGYNRTAVQSQVGLAVDNLDVDGFLDSSSLTEQDLQAGLFDFAEVRIRVVNWLDLSQGILRMRRGHFGEVTLSNGGAFRTELRGLTQAYSQMIIEAYQAECRVDLGDSRCRVDIKPPIITRSTAVVLGEAYRVQTNPPPLLDGVQLLVPADTTPDSVVPSRTGTLGSQAAVQTVQKVFGVGSLEFSPSGSVNPSNSFDSFVDDPALSIGANQFTIEFLVNFKSLTAAFQVMASHYNNTGNQRSWRVARFNNTLDFFMSDDGTSVAPALSISGAFTWLIDTDYHVALTRDSSDDVRMFVNGVQVGTTTSVTFALHDSTAPFWLGKFRSTGFDDSPMNGFMDDFRLTIGTALYTSNFTPPVVAHPSVEPTALTEVFENRIYRVTTAGTTAALQPTYDTTISNTTNDGTAVLTAEDSFRRHAVVASVTDQRIFSITVTEARAVDDWFRFGVLTFEDSNNAGVSLEIKKWTQTGTIVELVLFAPFVIQVGDKVALYAGCDKSKATCIAKFGNLVNFRGFSFVPHQDAYLTISPPR